VGWEIRIAPKAIPAPSRARTIDEIAALPSDTSIDI
jgi:hypothetical protein